ncbi:MAG: hypothetical protein IT258_15455 [Saprospiraceae bacterium]|nr:hypothetical protein [Saprospiraceae bacterium]
MAKSNIIPPSLQPRKIERKPIPQTMAPKEAAPPPPPVEVPPSPTPLPEPEELAKVEKRRFTLWLPVDVFRAFKIHTAGNDGSASAYIEELIRRDLNL